MFGVDLKETRYLVTIKVPMVLDVANGRSEPLTHDQTVVCDSPQDREIIMQRLRITFPTAQMVMYRQEQE